MYRQALERDPADVEALRRLGILLSPRDPAEALRLLGEAVALRPDDARTHNDLGVALDGQGDFAGAARCYRRAVELRPGYYQVWANLASALLHAWDVEAAVEAVEQTLRLCKTYPPAHNTLGCILMDSGDLSGACRAFHEAIRLLPKFVAAHANLGLALLAQGDFANGWRELEWRRKSGDPSFDRPGRPWEGSDPFGQSLLLYGDGGLGDAIQFSRFVTVLADMGAIVCIECHAKLVPLLRSIKGGRQVVAVGDPLPHYDFHCPLKSVPALLGTTIGAIPACIPYLEVEADRIERWREVIAAQTPKQSFRIGVCWQGEQKLPYMRDRSFDPMHLAALEKLPGITLINLQYGAKPPEGLGLLTLPGLESNHMPLEDAAAVMTHLDLVVTCDTSTAHLAGALGVPVWVALKHAAEWRWMRDRDDSPWYPSMKLFRQERAGDWRGVFSRMAEAIGQ